MRQKSLGTDMPEFIASPLPMVELQRIAAPYTDNGTLGEARRLPIEELRLYLAYAEHDQALRTMRADLAELRRNQPPQPKSSTNGNSEHENEAANQRMEWQETVNIVTASLLEEDRCFTNPLDDEWGESLEPQSHVLHWFSAPGGPFDVDDLQRDSDREGLA